MEFPLTTSGSFKNWKTGILECVPTANRDEHHSYGANSTNSNNVMTWDTVKFGIIPRFLPFSISRCTPNLPPHTRKAVRQDKSKRNGPFFFKSD